MHSIELLSKFENFDLRVTVRAACTLLGPEPGTEPRVSLSTSCTGSVQVLANGSVYLQLNRLELDSSTNKFKSNILDRCELELVIDQAKLWV